MSMATIFLKRRKDDDVSKKKTHGTERFGGGNLGEVESVLHFVACGCGLPVESWRLWNAV